MDYLLFEKILKSHRLWLETDGEDGRQAHFEKMDLQDLTFQNTDLRYAIFKDANLTRCKLYQCSLKGADFSGSNLSYSDCQGVDLSYSNLKNANFDGASVIDSDLSYTKLDQTNFLNMYSRNIDFSHSQGENLIFSNSVLMNALFKEAVFKNPNFFRANVTNAVFKDTIVIDADMDGIVGIPIEKGIIEETLCEEKYIARKAQIKTLKWLGSTFYLISTLILSIIVVLGSFEVFEMFTNQGVDRTYSFSYLSWLSFIIVLFVCGTLSKLAMFWLIRDDKKNIEEQKNG